MNILVLNGSPKGEKSNTLKLTHSFLDGLGNNHNKEIINIKSMNINHCNGCFACWHTTPGKCVIKDDMDAIIEKYIKADIIIWSFPLYYYSMPSKIKAVMDRLLPTNLPFILTDTDGCNSHPHRYDLSHQKYILISTCGFYSTKNNYDSLYKQFEILYPNNFEKIICTEGELFRVPQLEGRTNEYLGLVTLAGEEYANNFAITETTKSKLSELLYEPEIFVQMADASWNIPKIDNTKPTTTINKSNPSNSNNEPSDTVLDSFMKQMSLIYNPSKDISKPIVLEMNFTDKNKTYQLILDKEKCTLKTDNFSNYTTRIETTFSLWKDISAKKINGASALMEKKYKVLGDFSTMLKMDDLFGLSEKPKAQVSTKTRKSNMLFLLLPWIALWAGLPISPLVGGIIAIIISVLLPILPIKLTPYDKVSIPIVSVLGILGILNVNLLALVILSYLFFAILWLVSIFTKIPLSAYYSCNKLGGESAFNNPLFIKTNRILSFIWSILYFILMIIAILLMLTPLAHYTGAFTAIGPAILGIFTAWFSRWYPAHVARG